MADVFISYANQDRERIRILANAIESQGWSVWWDRRIIAGQSFDQVIEHELESAKSVVVMWSTESISSEWVKNEATAAAERGVLVPVLIDDVRPPLEFRRKQTASLIGWDGDLAHPGFQNLCKGIEASTGVLYRRQHGSETYARHGSRLKRLGTLAAVVVIPALLVVAAYWGWTSMSSGGASGRSLKVETLSNDGHSINNPLSIQPGVVYKVTLDENEPSYFRLSSPTSNVKVVLDMRSVSGKRSVLQSSVDLLNEDGAVIEDRFIHFNELDLAFRKTAQFAQKQPGILGLKLLNTNDASHFWLTVFTDPAPPFVPFLAELHPQSLDLEQEGSGLLDNDEYVYYRTNLAKGDYKVFLDFSTRKGDRAVIQGYLAVLDADGGKQRELIRLNELDVSYRKIAALSLIRDETLITRIANDNGSINYTVKITSDR